MHPEHMPIHEFGYDTPDGDYCVFGINVAAKNGRPVINMFDLEENKDGPKVSDHIWSISGHILNLLLNNKYKRNEVSWSFTTGFNETNIEFKEINNKPSLLNLSNATAFNREQQNPFSYARCRDEYYNFNSRPMHESQLELRQEYVREPTPYEMFAVPCPHSPDGVFYCKPPAYKPEGSDSYEFVLVDTKKLIQRLKQDDPRILEHAQYKFNGHDAKEWLSDNSFRNETDTASFVVGNHIREINGLSPGLGITLNSGNAGILVLAQELDLPFIPIQIEKHGLNGPNDPEHINKIRQIQSEIGYIQDEQPYKRHNRPRL